MAEDVEQRQAGAKANSTVENMRDAFEANGAA